MELTIQRLIEASQDLNKILALNPPIKTTGIAAERLKSEITQLAEYKDKKTGKFDLQPGDIHVLQPKTVEVIYLLSPATAKRVVAATVPPKGKAKTNRSILLDRITYELRNDPERKERRKILGAEANLKYIERITNLHYTVNIPQQIVDAYLSVMSPSACKVLIAILRWIEFDPDSRLFATCRSTHERIEQISGVKSVRRYEKELVELGIIIVKAITTKENGMFRTIHHYEIPFLKIRREQERRDL